jgi:putative membrane protein
MAVTFRSIVRGGWGGALRGAASGLAVVVALATAPAAGRAADRQPPPPPPGTPILRAAGGDWKRNGVSGGDQQIVAQLHLQNQHEIALARLAQERATSDEIQTLAGMLAANHERADLELLGFADLRGMDRSFIAQPGADRPLHDALALNELERTPAAAFDNAFAARVVADHQAAIDQAVSARRIARDAGLRSLLDEVLPELRGHLHAAEEILAVTPAPPEQRVSVPLPQPPS